jgi:hypothetical protein
MLSLTSVLALGLSTPLPPAPQESATHFDAPLVVVDGKHRFERTLDLDGDGVQDAFGWFVIDNYYSKFVLRGYRNDGTGRLVESWSQTVNQQVTDEEVSMSAVADFDGDGRDDFAFTVGDMVRVYRSNGVLVGPTPLLAEYTGVASKGMTVGDFNDDGAPDVAVFGGDSIVAPRKVRVYWNQQNGTFFPGVEIATDTTTAVQLQCVDVNADGRDDLLYNVGNTVVSHAQLPGGGFGPGQPLVHGITMSPMLTHGDIDGDGDTDLVVFGKTTYAVVRRTGANSWAVEAPQVGGPATGLADIDGDGDLDGVCCGSGGPTDVYNNTDSKFELSLNDGSGAFAPAYRIQGLGSHHLAGAVDLDQDGDVDLVAGRCIYYSRGGLGTPPQVALPTAFGGVVPSQRGAFDRDGDGDPDYASGGGPWLTNRGDGQVVSSPATVVGLPIGWNVKRSGFGGDFDGDGHLDVVTSAYINNAFQEMHLLRGDGAGGYVDAGPAGAFGVNFNAAECLFCAPSNPDDPSTGFVEDFDGDGDLDLGVAGKSHFWLNNGSGFFVAGPQISVTGILRGSADFDGDGHLDLWMSYTHSQGVHFGLGGGAFGPYVTVGNADTLNALDEIAIADLDGDGDLDVASVDGLTIYQAQPVLYWNDGSGSFSEEALADYKVAAYSGSSTAKNPRRIFARDVDADGLLDLVIGRALFNVWPEQVGVVRILRRNAANDGYLPAVNQVLDPTGMLDFDGDGDDDVLGTMVSFGTRFEGDAVGSRLQYGFGFPGSGGLVPVLGATGPFRMGHAPTIRLRGAVGGAFSALLVGTGATQLGNWPVPGSTLWVDVFSGPWFLIHLFGSGVPGAAGQGTFTLPVSVGPALIGAPFMHQAFAIDLGAAGFVASSNGLQLTYGP